MKMSKSDIKKIKWLINHPGFSAKPVRAISRILKWELIRLSEKPIQFIYDNDLSVLLYPEDGVARLVFYFDYHEPIEFRFLNHFISKEMICVDVGANIGMYTLFFAKRAKLVYSFDPLVIAFQKLEKIISDNHLSNIVCVEKAVSSQNQKLGLVMCNDSSRTYTTLAREVNIQNFVEAVSLDNYFAVERIERLDYLKIDAEGAEASILQGARYTINQFRPCIQVEIANGFSDRQPENEFTICDYLSQLSYQMFKIDSRVNGLTPGISWNTIAIPEEKVGGFKQKGFLKT